MSGSDFLADMARSSAARVAQARARVADGGLLSRALATPLPPRLHLSAQGFDLIAEVKLRSPAAGQLKGGNEDIAARVRQYAEAGAAAISVLTEPSRFDGSLDHLRQAVESLDGRCPAMRKDFLVDPYQVIEARLAGAGGVLAILRMVPESTTAALLDMAAQLGLFVLLEAFDADDLQIARRLLASHGAAARAARAPLLVGVNCRDLVTLQVVPGRLDAIAAKLPADAPRVAESGIEDAADVARLAVAGYDLALVGSALMRAGDPRQAVHELLQAARAAKQRRAHA